MRKTVDIEFDIKDIVYLKTNRDQCPRIVTAVVLRECGHLYQLCQGTQVSDHYGMEISKEVNVLVKLSNV